MNKQEFFSQLRAECTPLTPREQEERVAFLSEMIDDYMEEGFSEAEAIAKISAIDIAVQPCAEPNVTESVSKKRPNAWGVVALILGAPVWLSLLIAAAAVILSLYVSLWSVILSVWATFLSLIAAAAGGLLAGSFQAFVKPAAGLALIGAALVCAGLAIFLFFGCKAATKGAWFLTKSGVSLLKRPFVKKEGAV